MKKTPYKLNNYEKETILLTSEGDTEVSFETFNASLKKRLAAFSKQYPELCRLVRSNDDGLIRFIIITEKKDGCVECWLVTHRE